mmetsp:Transcript_40622/g.49433  ORF Transcript_40622/g.49433 Transcript_40622/m.49433 type:complete len:244 (-) Transcript_40622:1966-2697(-)
MPTKNTNIISLEVRLMSHLIVAPFKATVTFPWLVINPDSEPYTTFPSSSVVKLPLTLSQTFCAPLLFNISSGCGGSIPAKDSNSPSGTLSLTANNCTSSSASAASNMAVLSTPLIFAGFKLVNNTTFLFTNSSTEKIFAKPATTVRSSSAPQETRQTSNASASGCCSAERIVPTFNATLRTSSTGCCCCCFCFAPPRFRPPAAACWFFCGGVAHVSLKVTMRLKANCFSDADSSNAKYPHRSN